MWNHFFFPWSILWILLIVFVICRPWGWRRRRWNGYHQRNSPEDILKERLAKGEINEKEYEEKLAVLRKSN
jgi:uncharacterized membrane protein